MANFLLLSLLLFTVNPSPVLCRNLADHSHGEAELKTYIIHVKHPETVIADDQADLDSYYHSFLPKTTANSGESRMVYTYGTVFSGFAARLTEEEVEDMDNKEGFIRAFPNRIIPLLTTHTPDFLGLTLTSLLWNVSSLGKGVIMGVIDSGVDPAHPSFNDDGVPPPPARWKGDCSFHTGCNNKIIGARSFHDGDVSSPPFDDLGHGTHTASTAAGNFVRNVTFSGLANGTAAGMAPHAHLAIYRVCFAVGCANVDVLAGLDAAVKDGVDVLSLSLGGTFPYNLDPIAIGGFGAIQNGVVVVCAAGNSGPEVSSVFNDAPWLLTVAATTVDRRFQSTVKLGNGGEFYGETLFQPANFKPSSHPLIYPGADITTGDPFCNALDRFDIRGKVVMCSDSGGKSSAETGQKVKTFGGVGMIVLNTERSGLTVMPSTHVLPAAQVTYQDGQKIIQYVTNSSQPTASISLDGTVVGTSPAPTVASFSGRGPSRHTPQIIKPDIVGPGVNILAAWPSPVGAPKGTRLFNIISGTSMATPHVSGIAALVKSVHPSWSPAMIKSVIMTSADDKDRHGNPILDETGGIASSFLIGSGLVNPNKAVSLGLVYDLGVDDYIRLLCSLHLEDSTIAAIVRRNDVRCRAVEEIAQKDLNYPSIVVAVGGSEPVEVNRTVTYVEKASATYTLEVDMPKGVEVSVTPEKLHFSKVNEKKSFTVRVVAHSEQSVEGSLKLVSGKHVVRSPLVVLGRT